MALPSLLCSKHAEKNRERKDFFRRRSRSRKRGSDEVQNGVRLRGEEGGERERGEELRRFLPSISFFHFGSSSLEVKEWWVLPTKAELIQVRFKVIPITIHTLL